MKRLERLEKDLWRIVHSELPTNDPSHDPQHIRRVLAAVKKIQENEGGDLEILIPAALFHDIVIYPKNDPRSKLASQESADFAERILEHYNGYTFPREKIAHVARCIKECSWSNRHETPASSLESRILQDADRLEATGALSIMRTFTSGGQMNRPLYNHLDPFCIQGVPQGVSCSMDLFYQRLLQVEETLHSKTAKRIARHRTHFLKAFLLQTERELEELGLLP